MAQVCFLYLPCPIPDAEPLPRVPSGRIASWYIIPDQTEPNSDNFLHEFWSSDCLLSHVRLLSKTLIPTHKDANMPVVFVVLCLMGESASTCMQPQSRSRLNTRQAFPLAAPVLFCLALLVGPLLILIAWFTVCLSFALLLLILGEPFYRITILLSAKSDCEITGTQCPR